MSDHMIFKDWRDEYAKIFQKKVSVSKEFAMSAAHAAEEAWEENCSPSEAVDDELSYWND